MILPDPSRMPVGMPIIRQGPTDCQEAVGRAADRASSVSRLGPINRTVHRTCGAEGFGSDRIGLRPSRGLGGSVYLQALWESGLCRRGNPPLGIEPFGLRQ